MQKSGTTVWVMQIKEYVMQVYALEVPLFPGKILKQPQSV